MLATATKPRCCCSLFRRSGCSFGGSEPIVSPRINYHLLSGCWLRLCVDKARSPGVSGKRRLASNEKTTRAPSPHSAVSCRETKGANLAATMAADVETFAVFPRRSCAMLQVERRRSNVSTDFDDFRHIDSS